MTEGESLAARIREVTGWRTVTNPAIITDTSDPFRINRGDVVRLGGRDFVVRGHKYELRFGISHQPKYWVLSTIDLDDASPKILKTVFHEEFFVHIALFRIHCFRSPEKESRVLDLVRGDPRFMQGYTEEDAHGNRVRILDVIPGPSILNYIYDIEKSHEQYFAEDLPGILHNLLPCLEAIKWLHDRGTCHGDVRNDHILVEKDTGLYRWIDFDLNQHVSDYDLWSLGNIINYAVGKGITSFDRVFKSGEYPDTVKHRLATSDASAFYEYRIMNLRTVYPYIPKRLNDILLHFTVNPKEFYTGCGPLIDDYREMLDSEFPAP